MTDSMRLAEALRMASSVFGLILSDANAFFRLGFNSELEKAAIESKPCRVPEIHTHAIRRIGAIPETSVSNLRKTLALGNDFANSFQRSFSKWWTMGPVRFLSAL